MIPGSYLLGVTVLDSKGYYGPLKLAIRGAISGFYPLGNITVSNPITSSALTTQSLTSNSITSSVITTSEVTTNIVSTNQESTSSSYPTEESTDFESSATTLRIIEITIFLALLVY